MDDKIKMDPRVLHLLNGDEAKYPYALEQGFPRILEKIVAQWDTPAMPAYFYELMVDTRGGATRQGFPPTVAADIFNLHNIYSEQLHETAESTNVWEHVSEKNKRELEQLGFSYSKADFLKAVESGNERAIDVFMSCGVDLEARDERDWTPLMISAFNGNEKLALMLIQRGAKIQAEDRNGYTPLHWSAFNGYVSVVKLLLDKGAQINARSQFGWTALMQAATKGRVEVVKTLLKKGALVNETTTDGWTALHKAAANGHSEIVLLLLENGADKTIAYPDGSTALSLANKNKHEAIVRILNSSRIKPIV